MYDIETDIENVAKAIYRRKYSTPWKLSATDGKLREEYLLIARAALNASTSVKHLKRDKERIKKLEKLLEAVKEYAWKRGE